MSDTTTDHAAAIERIADGIDRDHQTTIGGHLKMHAGALAAERAREAMPVPDGLGNLPF